MPIQYTTVYQITQLAPDWPLIWFGVAPLVVGAVIVLGIRRFKWTKRLWPFAVLSCVIGVMWVAAIGWSTLIRNRQALRAFQNGEYRTIEGVVSDFRQGRQKECFSVQDQRFCYSDYEIAPGFHTAASHGGPIRTGLQVRIAYREGRILRLDIRQ